MKKFILVISLFMLSLSACAKENNTDVDKVIELYEKAIEKQQGNTSSHIKMKEDASVSFMGENLNLSIIMDLKMNSFQENNQEAYLKGIIEAVDETEEMEIYVKDGYMYTNSLGMKEKRKIDTEELEDNEYISEMFATRMFDKDKLKNVKLNEKKENTEFSFDIEIDKEELDEYFSDFMSDSIEQLGNFDFEIGKLHYDVVLDKDGNFINSTYTTSFTIEISDTDKMKMDLKIDLSYLSFDKQEIEFPNFDDYQELDAVE